MNETNHKRQPSWIINVNNRRHKWAVSAEWMVSIALTICLWLVLYQEIASQLLGARRQQSLNMLIFLVVVSAIIFVIMGGWQFYNWYLFHGKERRKAFKKQPLSEVASLYGMSETEMAQMQGDFRQAEVVYAAGRYWYVLPEGRRIEITSLREKDKKV